MKNNIVEWKDIFSVGVDIIDLQHKKFISLLNKFYNIQKCSLEQVKYFLEELYDYSIYHFRTEEQIAKQINYPQIDNHHKEHQNFIAQIKKWLENPQMVYDFELFDFMVDWTVDHILNCDQKMGQYILNNKIQIDLKNLNL